MGSGRRGLLIIPATAALVLLSACGSSNGSSGGGTVPTQSGPVTVGVIAPFTGPAAQFGKLLSAPVLRGHRPDQPGGRRARQAVQLLGDRRHR